MLNHTSFIKSEDKNKVIILLNEVRNILDKYEYSLIYTSNMDRLKTSVIQSIGYANMLLVDCSDIEEDK